VTTGVAYTYAVIAVDRAGNQSAPSERQTVVVR
jgi:fibronectin type 3 domain-containing protein